MRLRVGYSWVLPFALVCVAAGGCEEPLADGTQVCSPEQAVDCPDGYVCRQDGCRYWRNHFCYRRQPGDRESYAGAVCVVNGECEARACENRWNCPEDCLVVCDIPELTSHPAEDYLAAELFVPTSTTAAKEIGADLDFDGEVDNKLGSLLSLLTGFHLVEDPAVAFARFLRNGDLLLILRFWREDGDDAGSPPGLAQLLVGEIADATPVFDGNDTVAMSGEASVDAHLCGAVANGTFRSDFSTDPVRLPLPLAVPGAGAFVGTFEVVKLQGRASSEGWVEVDVGGAITKGTLETELYPWLVDQMNRQIQRAPDSPLSVNALDIFDDNCEPTLPGCDPAPVGCARDGVLSIDELLCNAILNSAAAPDVDLDGDGEKDVLSIGFRVVSAVPVTVVE